jgi:hypothetical protein
MVLVTQTKEKICIPPLPIEIIYIRDTIEYVSNHKHLDDGAAPRGMRIFL